MSRRYGQVLRRSLVVVIVSMCGLSMQAAVGLIDLDISEPASNVFEMYYYNGSELVCTDYAGFKAERYPLNTGGTYLITDTLSLMCQRDVGMSFVFNGQGLQTIKLELTDLDGTTLWTFYDGDLYSGTQAQNGKVPYREVYVNDVAVTASSALPDLCRLKISAVSGKDTYGLHLHALNLYSAPLPWDKCRIDLSEPITANDQSLYLNWITLNGASEYRVVTQADGDTAPTVVPVPAQKHATHHIVIPLSDVKTMTYRIEAVMDGHTVSSPTWTHTVNAGMTNPAELAPSVASGAGGIVVMSNIDEVVEVYSIAGIRMTRQSIQRGMPLKINLPSGVYIAKFRNVALKAVVRR